MSPDFDPNWLGTVGIGKSVLLSTVAQVSLLAGAVVGAAFILAPKIRRAIDPARDDAKRTSELVPLRLLMADNQTIANEDGRLSHVYSIDGADIGSMTTARIKTLDLNRIAFLKAIREVISRKSGVEIKFLLERCRRGRLDEQDFPADQPVMGRISAAWRKGFKTRFETRYYIVVSVGPKTRGARETLEEIWRAAQTSLKEFRPVRLGQTVSDDLPFFVSPTPSIYPNQKATFPSTAETLFLAADLPTLERHIQTLRDYLASDRIDQDERDLLEVCLSTALRTL
jgi:hypothetical protein